MLLIALVSILYGSVLAFTQTNARLILGYSSIAQLGFITLGIFALGAGGRRAGRAAADGQPRPRRRAAVLHHRAAAERTAARRTCATWAASRSARRCSPRCSWSSRWPRWPCPGSANFVGEFLILLGLFNAELAIAIIASTGVALASVYMLRMYIRSDAQPAARGRSRSCEISVRDGLVLVPLVLVIIAFALYPQQALRALRADRRAGRRRRRGRAGRPGGGRAVTGSLAGRGDQGAARSTGWRCRRSWR